MRLKKDGRVLNLKQFRVTLGFHLLVLAHGILAPPSNKICQSGERYEALRTGPTNGLQHSRYQWL